MTFSLHQRFLVAPKTLRECYDVAFRDIRLYYRRYLRRLLAGRIIGKRRREEGSSVERRTGDTCACGIGSQALVQTLHTKINAFNERIIRQGPQIYVLAHLPFRSTDLSERLGRKTH